MTDKSDLQELTGHESGTVYFLESNELLICNWVGISGIPRQFVTGLIGLNDDLTEAHPTDTPQAVKAAMLDHERMNGETDPENTGYRSWAVGEVVITVKAGWA